MACTVVICTLYRTVQNSEFQKDKIHYHFCNDQYKMKKICWYFKYGWMYRLLAWNNNNYLYKRWSCEVRFFWKLKAELEWSFFEHHICNFPQNFFLHEQFIVFKFFLFLSVKIPISCFKIYIYFIEKNECENPLLPAAGQSSLSLPSSSLGLPARNLVMPSFYVYKKKKIESKSINQS